MGHCAVVASDGAAIHRYAMRSVPCGLGSHANTTQSAGNPAGALMDRNGKKPKKSPAAAPHAERSDTKAHSRDDTESAGAESRAAAERAEADERQARASKGQKGPQQL